MRWGEDFRRGRINRGGTKKAALVRLYETVTVPARGYVHHEFPRGFSAHWVRLSVDKDCRATAYFMYR